jgi:hypothetical protein
VPPSSIVGWHDAHLVSVGCGAGGGTPWQLPHVACEPSTRVQVGVDWAPPTAALPWHPVVHVVPFHAAPGPAAIENVSSARLSPSM